MSQASAFMYWWSPEVQHRSKIKPRLSVVGQKQDWWLSLARASKTTRPYDYIVIGAGLMGSASAFELSRQGKHVLLLEQFGFDHTNGSSFGESRVIRREYKDPPLSDMINAAYDLWDEAQNLAGEKVIHTTGSVDIAPTRDSPDLAKTMSIIDNLGLEHEVLTGKELKERFPMYKGVPDGYCAVYQPHSGVGEPSAAIAMYLKLAKKNGCTLLDRTKVTNVERPSDNEVIVTTDTGAHFKASGVVLCTGAWSSASENHVLGKMGLGCDFTVDKLTTAYYRPTDASQAKAKELSNMPWFLLFDNPMCYGIGPAPGSRGSGLVKIGPFWCDEGGSQPETRDFKAHKPTVAKLDSQATSLFGDELVTPATKAWTCLTSMSADGNFVVDQPLPNVTLCCCMSGHGFKFTSVMGYIVAELAITGKSRFDISPFKWGRKQEGSGHVFAELFAGESKQE